MLAKGHDFPGVTLVGILFADALLALPEFRAAERTYQLITQMAGRAGRGARLGRVIVQAYDTEHPPLVAAAMHQPEIFYERELRIRRLADYPPWVSLLQIRVEDRNARKGEELASHLARGLRGVCESRFRVLGPAPAPLARLKGMFRRQIVSKAKQAGDGRGGSQGSREQRFAAWENPAWRDRGAGSTISLVERREPAKTPSTLYLLSAANRPEPAQFQA
jgi:primosomal protein N' (replication factor Y)